MTEKKIDRNDILKKAEVTLYTAAFVLYVGCSLLQNTMFSYLEGIESVLVKGRHLTLFLLAILYCRYLAGDLAAGLKNKSERKRLLLHTLTDAAVLLIFAVSARISENNNLIYLVLFCIVFRTVSFRYISNVYLIVHGLVFAAALVCSLTGVIENLKFTRTGSEMIRYSLGYVYPSVLMTSVLFCVFVWLWKADKNLKLWELLLIEVGNLVLFWATNAKISFGLLIVIPVLCYLIKIFGRNTDIRFRSEKAKKAVSILYSFLPVELLVLSIIGCLIVDTPLGTWLDNMVTHRFMFGRNGMKQFGIPLFGNYIEWIGYGGSVKTYIVDLFYNFVDCSYIHDLVNYGILVTAVTMTVSVMTLRRIWKNEKSAIRCVIAGAVFFYCVVEPRMLELYFNVFILLAAQYLKQHKAEEREK